MQLFAIIPRLPPVIDGIGYYALSLACLLRESIGIETRFIVIDRDSTGVGIAQGFDVIHPLVRTTSQFPNGCN
jgi:hypothetical protein